MNLDLLDPRLKAKVTPIPPDRARLTIEYPRIPEFRDKVLTALSNLLRPATCGREEESTEGAANV